MKKNNKIIGLWRTINPEHKLLSDKAAFPLKYVFPSGRQALSAAISAVNLGRSARVAVPEWSSHCVVSAVARYAMPIPLNEVIANKIKVDGVLLYEQWGWSFSKEVKAELGNYFKDSVFILDAVDSAGFSPEEKKRGKDFIHLTSLSKLLGLSGGGIVRVNGHYLEFKATAQSKQLLDKIKTDLPSLIMKQDIEALDEKLEKWLQQNDLLAAIEQERMIRQQNLTDLLNNSLTENWPAWMRQAVASGAGPGIAPLFRGVAKEKLVVIQNALLNNQNIETSIYNFNWSGNPLKPQYEPCLAFPVHGLVSNPVAILKRIIK